MTHRTGSSLQAAESLADPTEYENLFPGLKEAFAAEHYLRESCLGTSRPAKDYPLVTVSCPSFKLTYDVVVLCADNISIVVSQSSLLYCNKLPTCIYIFFFSSTKTGIFLRRLRDTSPKEPSFLLSPRFVCQFVSNILFSEPTFI